MTPDKPTGQPSFRFKLLAALGFIVVCIGLFAPKLFTFGSTQAPAENTSPLDPPPPPDGGSLGWTVAKMAVGVGLVAVVCIGVARYVNRKSQPAPQTSLQVLASLPVDGRCVVHLIRVADRRLLVGVDAGGVKAVAELPAEVPNPTPRVIGPVVVPADLAALFGSLLRVSPTRERGASQQSG